MRGPIARLERIDRQPVHGWRIVDELPAADVDADMINDFVVAADRVEEDQVAFLQAALAGVRT